MNKDSKIYIAGHSGLVGSALVRKLRDKGYDNLIFRESKELDLRDKKEVDTFFEKERPEFVFLTAARVGGIKANMEKPAEFIFDNISIQNNVIDAAYRFGVKKLLFTASNCIYPTKGDKAMKEEDLLMGKFEPTNEGYAIAKLAGIGMCQTYRKQYGCNFVVVIPASLFGPNDNFDPNASHLVPALIRKFSEAKEQGKEKVVMWGTGKPRREIMFVDDLTESLLNIMEEYDSGEILNLGVGKDFSVKEIGEMVAKVVGYEGEVSFDTNKPDGMMRKLLDSSKAEDLGLGVKTDLENGLRKTHEWFVKEYL